MLSLADIELLFARQGASQYSGEPVTQLEHLANQAELRTPPLAHFLGRAARCARAAGARWR